MVVVNFEAGSPLTWQTLRERSLRLRVHPLTDPRRPVSCSGRVLFAVKLILPIIKYMRGFD
ncbi:hypothetical protein RSAG8_05692, partial [Rhizoctonia solani AG-8 WAC10335]